MDGCTDISRNLCGNVNLFCTILGEYFKNLVEAKAPCYRSEDIKYS